ncbi:MAG: FAD-binding protein, partial [Flavobacteriales bacterium]
MTTQLQFTCTPEQAQDELFLAQKIRKELRLKDQDQFQYRWKKRSIDARQRQIKINATLEIAIEADLEVRFQPYQFSKITQKAQTV